MNCAISPSILVHTTYSLVPSTRQRVTGRYSRSADANGRRGGLWSTRLLVCAFLLVSGINMASSTAPIYVLGCGIVGLTSALRLQDSAKLGAPIHIIARHLPGDPLTPSYASTAAGAHHLSFADNSDQLQRWLDTRTFEVMWEELAARGVGAGEDEGRPDHLGLMKLVQTEYFDGEETQLELFEGLPDVRFIRLPVLCGP